MNVIAKRVEANDPPQRIAYLDRRSVAELHAELCKHLSEFAEARGLQATVGAASFTANNMIVKVELAVVGADGAARTREAELFLLHASCQGLSPAHLGKSFTLGGRTYKIIGLNTRNKNNPIIVEDDGGRHYKMAAAQVRVALAAADAPVAPSTSS